VRLSGGTEKSEKTSEKILWQKMKAECEEASEMKKGTRREIRGRGNRESNMFNYW
jgi:hypothetical protein